MVTKNKTNQKGYLFLKGPELEFQNRREGGKKTTTTKWISKEQNNSLSKFKTYVYVDEGWSFHLDADMFFYSDNNREKEKGQ